MFGQNYLFNTPQTSELTSPHLNFLQAPDWPDWALLNILKLEFKSILQQTIQSWDLGRPGSLCFPLNNLPSRLRETPSILIRQVSSLLNLGRKQTKILKKNILQL